jgi:hypothetical protein
VVRLADLIRDVAERTARRFYSLGLLAGDPDATRPAELPALVAPAGARGYLVDGEKRHLARFERDATGNVRWDLDARCFADEARVLLPEAGGAALSALEHLFRDPIVVEDATAKNGPLALGPGKVTVLVEDDDGTRRVVATRTIESVAADATLVDLPDDALVARHVAVVFRGVDANKEPIVVSAERTGEPPAIETD